MAKETYKKNTRNSGGHSFQTVCDHQDGEAGRQAGRHVAETVAESLDLIHKHRAERVREN